MAVNTNLQNWELWDFDQRPNYVVETGNPTVGFGGGTVFQEPQLSSDLLRIPAEILFPEGSSPECPSTVGPSLLLSNHAVPGSYRSRSDAHNPVDDSSF